MRARSTAVLAGLLTMALSVVACSNDAAAPGSGGGGPAAGSGRGTSAPGVPEVSMVAVRGAVSTGGGVGSCRARRAESARSTCFVISCHTAESAAGSPLCAFTKARRSFSVSRCRFSAAARRLSASAVESGMERMATFAATNRAREITPWPSAPPPRPHPPSTRTAQRMAAAPAGPDRRRAVVRMVAADGISRVMSSG
jgi:hypothetical protein